ncbi:MAG: hypothetical protein C0600_15380 [Ignavibacteria bacterium]|nr:MAG: hypothetical protein C0600_15380 [Ignavibacteria bacterium]
MSVVYTVYINGREYRVERSEEDTLLINGKPFDAERYVVNDGVMYRFNRKSYATYAVPTSDDEPQYHVTVNGKGMSVELEDEKTALMKSFQIGKATQLQSATVRSPMPGKITRIMVTEGELIEAGQGVIILEAMKMENEIKAPSAGIVKAIRVKEADAVEKNTVLIDIS